MLSTRRLSVSAAPKGRAATYQMGLHEPTAPASSVAACTLTTCMRLAGGEARVNMARAASGASVVRPAREGIAGVGASQATAIAQAVSNGRPAFIFLNEVTEGLIIGSAKFGTENSKDQKGAES